MDNLNHLALMHSGRQPRGRDQATPGDWANVLAQFPLFAGIRKRHLRKLAQSATFAEYAPGEGIVFAGEPADQLYIILAGHARTTSNGRRRVLRTGDYLGDIAVMDARPAPTTVRAMSHVHVMKLPSRSVLKLARRHPALTLTMLDHLTTRLRRLEAEGAPAT
jgi:thioredoxin reductase (NADPH)